MPDGPDRPEAPHAAGGPGPSGGSDVPGVDAAALIRALARPRMTGSAGAADVERDLRSHLMALGYRVDLLPFTLSTWPAGLGVPVLAVILLVGAGAAWWSLRAGAPGCALLASLAMAGVAAAGLLATPWAILRLPFGRVRGCNWLARRSERPPALVVVAHRDSKSQAVPTLVRSAAAGLAILGWATLLLAAASALAGVAQPWLPHAGLAFSLIGGAGLLPAVTRNRSPGALDNATGLAALLLAARDQRENDDVGFLVTDAEEFGLAGAAAAAGRPPLDGVRAVINMDGLDDAGPMRVCDGHGFPVRDRAPVLTAAVAKACGDAGLATRTGTLPPGLLCDHIPFAAAGVPAVTLMRGRLASLARVHRPSDTPDRLTGDGAEQAARAVSRALDGLRRQGFATSH